MILRKANGGTVGRVLRGGKQGAQKQLQLAMANKIKSLEQQVGAKRDDAKNESKELEDKIKQSLMAKD
jgi:hypothetical protein